MPVLEKSTNVAPEWKEYVPKQGVLQQCYALASSQQWEKLQECWDEAIENVPVEFKIDVATYLTELCEMHLLCLETRQIDISGVYNPMAVKYLGEVRLGVSRATGKTPQSERPRAAEAVDVFARMVEQNHHKQLAFYQEQDAKIVEAGLDPYGLARRSQEICMDIQQITAVLRRMQKPIKLRDEVEEGTAGSEVLDFNEEFLTRVQELCGFKQSLVTVPFQKFDVLNKYGNGIDPTEYVGTLPAKICLYMIWTVDCSWPRYPIGYQDLEERISGCVAALGLHGFRVKDIQRFISAVWLYSARVIPAEIVGRNIALAVELE